MHEQFVFDWIVLKVPKLVLQNFFNCCDISLILHRTKILRCSLIFASKHILGTRYSESVVYNYYKTFVFNWMFPGHLMASQKICMPTFCLCLPGQAGKQLLCIQDCLSCPELSRLTTCHNSWCVLSCGHASFTHDIAVHFGSHYFHVAVLGLPQSVAVYIHDTFLII